MYLKLDEDILKEIEERTSVEYDSKLGYVPEENIERLILNLLDEVHKLEEKNKELQKDIDENYEPIKIDPYLLYGVSEKDFI